MQYLTDCLRVYNTCLCNAVFQLIRTNRLKKHIRFTGMDHTKQESRRMCPHIYPLGKFQNGAYFKFFAQVNGQVKVSNI